MLKSLSSVQRDLRTKRYATSSIQQARNIEQRKEFGLESLRL